MFAPQVSTFVDNWIITPGVLADGTAVDAWPVIQRRIYSSQDAVLAAAVWDADTAYNQSLKADERLPSAHWGVYSRTVHIKRRCKDRKPHVPSPQPLAEQTAKTRVSASLCRHNATRPRLEPAPKHSTRNLVAPLTPPRIPPGGRVGSLHACHIRRRLPQNRAGNLPHVERAIQRQR